MGRSCTLVPGRYPGTNSNSNVTRYSVRNASAHGLLNRSGRGYYDDEPKTSCARETSRRPRRATSRALVFEFRSQPAEAMDSAGTMALSQAPVERRSAARLTARGFATAVAAGNVQAPASDVPSAGFEFGDATRTDIAIWHQAPVPMSTANPVALVWQGEVAPQDFGVNNTDSVLRWLWAWRIAFTMLCIGLGLAIILFVR